MERCPVCQAVIALVGRVHRCVPVRNLPPGAVKPRPPHPSAFKRLQDEREAREPPPAWQPVKRGRPRIEESPRQQPWKALGMSRRTWYRRRAELKRQFAMDGDPK
jgi:hypothetical protein